MILLSHFMQPRSPCHFTSHTTIRWRHPCFKIFTIPVTILIRVELINPDWLHQHVIIFKHAPDSILLLCVFEIDTPSQ